MQDILSEIIANKRFEIDLQKRAIDEDVLQDRLAVVSPCISLRNALNTSKTGIISEFKRRSPSKGWINERADITKTTTGYEKAGATALSVLTDEKYFGGSLNDLKTIRENIRIPILRKDFIVDPYQLYQAKLIGADAVLLIAAALPKKIYMDLLQKAHELKLEVLLEIHSESELDYITPDIDVIGVNNRHLGSFVTDVQHSFRIAEQLPKDAVLISESGISDVNTILKLRAAGFKGFLIGETVMRTKQPASTLKQFIKDLQQDEKVAR